MSTFNRKRISPEEKKLKKKKRVRALTAVLLVLVILGNSAYLAFVYSQNDFFKYWRTIYIETAMSTKSHQWLATWIIPKSIIDECMNNKATMDDIQRNVIGGTTDPQKKDNGNKKKPKGDDVLGQKNLRVGGLDYCGNEIVINDIEEGILVSKIEGNNFKGRIMLVDSTDRVYIGMTQYPGVSGMRILDMMEYYGAVAGVNASGFTDPDGEGIGDEVCGLSCSQGKMWGYYAPFFGSIVITQDDDLVVGYLGDWSGNPNYRDGMQFSPTLIANGQKVVDGSSGYGIQPRTGVGQREDGVMVFLNVDGRDFTYSIGCTVEDMADILLQYGVINAGACDSGATSVIAYKGEVITKNCSANPTLGRILPNAFMIEPKGDTKK